MALNMDIATIYDNFLSIGGEDPEEFFKQAIIIRKTFSGHTLLVFMDKSAYFQGETFENITEFVEMLKGLYWKDQKLFFEIFNDMMAELSNGPKEESTPRIG
jgi:hypothetical protein